MLLAWLEVGVELLASDRALPVQRLEERVANIDKLGRTPFDGHRHTPYDLRISLIQAAAQSSRSTPSPSKSFVFRVTMLAP